MNSLVCLVVVALAVAAQAGEAPIQKRGIVAAGYGLGYGGYASAYGHGHYGLPLAHTSVASYGHYGLHPAPLHYSKVVVPTVAKVAYPAYSYSAYPFGYSKFGYSGYPYAYSKLAYSAYPAFGYSKVVSPYHFW